MTILVTGGAGYIGSVVAKMLLEEGRSVVVLDDLSQGHRDAVPRGAAFVEGSVGDADLLDRLFGGRRVEAVVHLAASTQVAESVEKPAAYFENNVTRGRVLLDAMARAGVGRMIFSSSAAVYGAPAAAPIREDCAAAPANPYGETKLAFEKALAESGVAHVSLRYFNVAGAYGGLGEDHRPETHLVPNVLRVALGREPRVRIFGTDYATPDGTCVRDYVHVKDVARAHVAALCAGGSRIYNLGNGSGFSVRQVVDAARGVTGREIPCEERPRREGDPPVLVADAGRIRTELGWRPQTPDLETIIADAWRWHRKHPEGYAR
ncbi:MAG: UDP-glucose 4-epimerase GalE [Planctomycetota bacterium]|jgi:UDP-glucose 4-epimerase